VLTEFVACLTALRAKHPIFRRQRFFQGRPIQGSSIDDIAWLRPDSTHMTDEDWQRVQTQALTIYLNGQGIPDRDRLGVRIVDDSFLLLVNCHHQQVQFTLPDETYGRVWETVVDTADPLLANPRRRNLKAGARLRVPARAMLVMRCAVPGS
jgi:isoamylase